MKERGLSNVVVLKRSLPRAARAADPIVVAQKLDCDDALAAFRMFAQSYAEADLHYKRAMRMPKAMDVEGALAHKQEIERAFLKRLGIA